MDVAVFSSTRPLLENLTSLETTRLFSYTTHDPRELENWLPGTSVRTLVYLDASQYAEKEVARILQAAEGAENIRFGILDHLGTVEDPAGFFHMGAVDYIGNKLLGQGVDEQRIAEAIDWCCFEEEESEVPAVPVIDTAWNPSGPDWKDIRSGREYTFCFMFVEIDLLDEWKQKSGRRHLDEVKATFQKHIQHFAERLSGRIWMWMDLGGLILFPFDGTRCDVILGGIRLVLNRTIISAEEYQYHADISYRIALHIGNTLYRRRGNTGSIVSDSVNFLFHLGRQFAEPGNFYLTEPIKRFIPEGLEDCFTSAGIFEDVPVSRMRLPST